MFEGVPTVPTDNMYKFCGITGLILMVVAVVTPSVLNQHLADYQSEKVENLWANHSKFMFDVWNHDPLVKELKGEERNEYLMKQGVRLDNTYKKWQDIMREDLEYRRKRNEKHQDQLRFAGLFGFVLLHIGFFHWYRKVQRYKDELLLLEVQKARSEATRPQTVA